MFIQQFMDIAHANRWDEREILLHLRINLTEKAQECGQFDKTEDVLEELRSRFGITYRRARDKLDLMRKSSGQGIHELGMEISKLVKLAYPNMSAADREDMAMDRLAKVMNNVELRGYLIPLRPTSMRECLRLSDEFLQADNHGSRTPGLAAVAEEETTLLECMKALQQTVLQQGRALQQMQQQQLMQQQQMLQMQSYAQMAAPASTAAPAPAPRNRQQNKGCY